MVNFLQDLSLNIDKRNGYYEYNFKNYKEFREFIDPEMDKVHKLMTEVNHFAQLQEESNHSRSGDIVAPLPFLNDEIIFRGQANADWSLTPSLFRDNKFDHINDPRVIVKKEYSNLIKFQTLCDQAGVQIPGDSFNRREAQLRICENFSKHHITDFWHTDFHEVAAFAQHFGFETSSLDWSRSILTACYFASIGAMNVFKKDSEGKFSIWILNKNHIDPKVIKIVEPPKSINNHISHQNGLLTIAKISNDVTNLCKPDQKIKNEATINFSLENVLSFYKTDHLLLKLNIPCQYADDVFNYCNAYNFNACNLFRGAQGAVQHFKDLETLGKFISD